MEYRAQRTIQAAPEVVWAALLDVSSWPTWESGVTRVDGTAVDGGKVTVHSEVSPGRAFPVKVALDPERHVMTWTGGMPLGLFRGVRTFAVSPLPQGCDLVMHEVFSGPLLGPISKRMPDLQPSFDQFADGIKAFCEAR